MFLFFVIWGGANRWPRHTSVNRLTIWDARVNGDARQVGIAMEEDASRPSRRRWPLRCSTSPMLTSPLRSAPSRKIGEAQSTKGRPPGRPFFLSA
jgi:hypothetical protein